MGTMLVSPADEEVCGKSTPPKVNTKTNPLRTTLEPLIALAMTEKNQAIRESRMRATPTKNRRMQESRLVGEALIGTLKGLTTPQESFPGMIARRFHGRVISPEAPIVDSGATVQAGICRVRVIVSRIEFLQPQRSSSATLREALSRSVLRPQGGVLTASLRFIGIEKPNLVTLASRR